MSSWNDDISHHPFHETFAGFQEYLDGYSAGDDQPKADLVLTRAQTIIGRVKNCLDAADPLFLSPQRLAQLQKQITALQNELVAFLSDKNEAHLLGAHNHLDALLDVASRIPTIAIPEDAKRLAQSAVAFRDQSSTLVAGLQKQVDQVSAEATEASNQQQSLQKALESAKAEIESQKTRLDSAISEFQKQFSEAQNARQQSFADAEKQRESATQEKMGAWDEKLSALAAQHQKAFDQLVADSKNEHTKVVTTAEEASSNLLKEIESRRDKAKDIVGIIAGTGMAGGYQKDADQQRKAFTIWNVVTVFGFAGLIGFAVWLFVESVGAEDLGWSHILARLVAIVAFGLFAAYGGRMAMKHRESERQHRHKQLALESINAFLEDLEPDVQRQVKQKMADVFFTQSERSPGGDDDVAPTTIDGLMKLLGKMIDKQGK
jgi:chemotaxis protein histidine kinase CheA